MKQMNITASMNAAMFSALRRNHRPVATSLPEVIVVKRSR
jgi:hypothetical protein